jgi:hypothetical protein
MTSCRFVRTGLFVLVCVILFASSAAADRPGSGSDQGTGRVFFPNPVVTLQDQTLTDQRDADYPALAPAYQVVQLTHLDGSGYLRGEWAYVDSATGPLAFSTDNEYMYGRDDDRFEQVMAYYWVTEAQKYIQSLGFGVSRRPINMEAQDVRINQWGVDNSYSWDKHDILRFGKGGVDDAEDADVILHEYGHAMMDSQRDPFGDFGTSLEAGAIGEGFSDYWAATVAQVIAPSPDPACIADWDSISYTSQEPHCLRRLDEGLHYPEDLSGYIHHDGQIWSQALWDIRTGLGHVVADTIILEAQFDFRSDTSMPDAAAVTVDTAQRLYGRRAARAVSAAFEARGIL